MNKKKRGFTLLEVLVVVLIIGILAAVAVPQYQKAVLKSRYSALMPIAKSIANGNEAYYLEHGVYATSPASLDVAGQADYPDGTVLKVKPENTTSDSEEYSYVIAGRDNDFPLNYLVYQNHSPKFAGNIHCEADENNTMAQEVCQSLGGQYIDGSQTNGFMTYVLSGTRGDNDKLPTSLSKLKKTICANVSEENCVENKNKQTITAYTCGETSPSFQSSYYYQSWSYACTGMQYDLEGNELGERHLLCKEGTTPNANKTACEGTPTDTSGMFERIVEYDGTSKSEKSRSCVQKQNGECVEESLQLTSFYPNDSMSYQISYHCAPSAEKADGTCSEYLPLTGSESASNSSETRYDEQGNQIWQIQCTHRASDGTCTSLYKGTIDTYSAGQRTGTITASCTTSHYSDTNPCTEYSIHNSATGTRVKCEASNFNFDTFECAS